MSKLFGEGLEREGIIEEVHRRLRERLQSPQPFEKDLKLKCVTSLEEAGEIIERCIEVAEIGFDTETSGLDFRVYPDGLGGYTSKDRLAGICLAPSLTEGYYLPVGHSRGDNLPLQEVLELLRSFVSEHVNLVIHNAAFDLHVLYRYGIKITDPEKFYDSFLAGRLADAGQFVEKLSLKKLAKEHFGWEMLDFFGEGINKVKVGKTTEEVNFAELDPKLAYIYAAVDPIACLKLKQEIWDKNEALKAQRQIFLLERSFTPVLSRVVGHRLRIDKAYLLEKTAEMDVAQTRCQREINELAGQEVNVSSRDQLSEVLYGKLSLPTDGIKKGQKGFSTDADSLEKLRGKHPIIEKVTEHRSYVKDRGTYIRPMLEDTDEFGDLTVKWWQIGADTGRLSSTGGDFKVSGEAGLAIMTIPKWQPADPMINKMTDDIIDFRRAFIARPGYYTVPIDYAGEELRIWTNLTKEPVWTEMFLKDEDLHRRTASLFYGIPEDDVTKSQRADGKCVVAGTLIATKNGLSPIDQLVKHREEGFKDCSIEIVGKVGFKQAKQAYYGGIKPVKLVKAEGGFEIEVTNSHEHCVVKDGRIQKVKTEDLQVGDFLVQKVGTKVFGQERIQWVQDQFLGSGENFDYVVCRLCQKRFSRITSEHLKWVHFMSHKEYVEKFPNVLTVKQKDLGFDSSQLKKLELDEDVASLLGWLVSEGYRGRVHQDTVGSPEISDQIRGLSERVGGSCSEPHGDKLGMEYEIGSYEINAWFRFLGFDPNAKSGLKEIPWSILVSPKEVQQSFFKTLFEGDGSSNVSYTSKSKKLVSQLQVAMLNFGIYGRIHVVSKKKYGDFYTWQASSWKDMLLFSQEVGFLSNRKNGGLLRGIRGYSHVKSSEFLDGFYDMIKESYQKIAGEKSGLCSSELKGLEQYCRLKHRFGNGMVDRFRRYLPEEVTKLWDLGIRTVRIVSIEDSGEKEVFDIFEPEEQLMVANGFLTQDSTNFLMIYGGSAYTLASDYKIPEAEAEKIVGKIFGLLKKGKEWIDSMYEFAEKNSYTFTYFGRIRPLPHIQSKRWVDKLTARRQAINTPIQGTAADIIKIVMCNLARIFEHKGWYKEFEEDVRMLITMHDELVFEIRQEKINEILPEICRVMESAGGKDWKVPLKVEATIGYSWSKEGSVTILHEQGHLLLESDFKNHGRQKSLEIAKVRGLLDFKALVKPLKSRGVVAKVELEPEEFEQVGSFKVKRQATEKLLVICRDAIGREDYDKFIAVLKKSIVPDGIKIVLAKESGILVLSAAIADKIKVNQEAFKKLLREAFDHA